MKMSKKMSPDQRIATSALMELSARPTVLAIESGPQRRAPKAQALAGASNTVAPAAAASGNCVKTKYRHIHFFKDSGKFGTWSRPYKGCPQKRVYIGSFRSMYLSKRAQDRAYLKYKLDSKIQLHFKESDYALDEELRNTMNDLDFVKLLRAESRDYYKLAAERSKCLQSYYKPASEDEETQVLVGSFSKRTPEAKASSSTAIEEPAKVSRPKRRAKTLCSEVIRKVCSKKPLGAKTRCSKVLRKVCSKQLKGPSKHEIHLAIEPSLKSMETAPPSLAPDAVEDMFLDHVSIVRKQRNPRKSAFWKTINAGSTTTAGAQGSHAVATEIICAILSAIPISECESSSSLQLPASAHATPSCAKCTKLLSEATGGRFSSSGSIFCSLGRKFADQLLNMQADRINAAPLAAVTGANVNTVQHSTKQSQEALADPNHTTSDGARSNAVGPTEEVCLHSQGLHACRSTGRSSKRRRQRGLNRRTILAPQRAPLC